ncbi:MAG: hypothetical protein F6K19_05110 [Cyanothece sp. SIO1E1]|nr:hypothetical protein [Cyanothece sp. SIO1E1]
MQDPKRNERGRFIARPDSLGKTYGLRIRKDLDAVLAELAEQEGMSPTAWCRKVVEEAITTTQNLPSKIKGDK